MSDKTTRSGLLWEVERILSECDELPQVLLMENVPDVIGSRYISDFKRWEERLRELGYSNHTEILNSKDFGIPQNRERAFMVSILGSSLYRFPQKQPLKLRLKDMLEKEVDEKYYISDKLFNYFNGTSNGWERQYRPLSRISNHSHTITTREGNVAEASYIDESVVIPEDTTLGYALAHEGDGVYTNRPEQKRGVVQKQMIQTIKANSNDLGVVVYDDYNSTIRKDQDTIGTLTTNIGNDAPRNGYKVKEYSDYSLEKIKGNMVDENGLVGTITANAMQSLNHDNCHIVKHNLRIRKLTPKECYRLMGFGDEAFELAQPNQSNSSLYHQAGDSIVVNVLMELFRSLL
jgi:DNA (cytosine-5)-methyltransferase 1